jgi:hypothetical protein
LSPLRAKRAEMAGEIDAAERRADQLRADLIHIDAVLRLFDPEAIPAKRVQRSRRRIRL